MNVLLDTHALLWGLEDSPRLSSRARDVLSDPDVRKFVSAVSAYEICLKHALGKLPGGDRLVEGFEAQLAAIDCSPLTLTIAHAEFAGKLELSHKDPFDRMLMAQALVERMPIVSNETLFDAFGVERIW